MTNLFTSGSCFTTSDSHRHTSPKCYRPRHTQLLSAFPSLQNIVSSSSSWFNPIITGAANSPEWLPTGFWEHCSDAFLRTRPFQAPSSWHILLALLKSPPSRQWSHESDFIRLRFYPQWFVANSLSPQVVGLIKSWLRFPLPNSTIMDTVETTWISNLKRISQTHEIYTEVDAMISRPLPQYINWFRLFILVCLGLFWITGDWTQCLTCARQIAYCCITTPGLFLTFYYMLSLSCSA